MRLVGVGACAVLLFTTAANAQVTLYEMQFDGLATASLVGAPQGGWEGFVFDQAADPEIVELGGGNKAMKLAVNAEPADNAFRQESRAVLTLPATIDLTAWTELTLQYDLTLAPGSRHNVYFDFDDVPNKFLADAQIIQDSGYVQLVRQFNSPNGQNVAASDTTVTLKWVFDLANGTVDSFYGATQIDNASPVSLGNIIANDGTTEATLFENYSIGLVKDFRTATFGYDVLVDNFKITAVPEPASLALLVLGGLALIRRR